MNHKYKWVSLAAAGTLGLALGAVPLAHAAEQDVNHGRAVTDGSGDHPRQAGSDMGKRKAKSASTRADREFEHQRAISDNSPDHPRDPGNDQGKRKTKSKPTRADREFEHQRAVSDSNPDHPRQ